MSKQVDERVVSMEFDNRNFESNVKTSISTLDRLKKALKLDSAVKGLGNVDAAAKKINFSPLSSAIETVNAKFSAMQVIGMTALSNITSAAMNAGTQFAKALTIDPVISGFHEYETQIGAIQTILANTQSKGSTLQDVNRALDELNKYADQTIYNFTEMTKNIGTFTAAGVDLEKSVTSIKGIANLAAVSGSTSTQASQAMYQLSQALAAGRVSLMDWNSVVNAGMGGELFQNALKRTAEHMGTNVDALIEKYGSFRESLTEGQWLTTDVLTETLTQLSGAYTEADLIAQGYTESQAKEITQLAETAVNAATKVKTFTALFDTLGEALQSGWTQSWEIILGDFNEAQELFTGISEKLGAAINASADARNNVLMGGLASGWKQFLDKGINDEQGFIESIKTVANEHGIAVDKMMEDGTTFEQTLKSGWLTSDMLTESVTKYVDGLSQMSAEQRNAAGYTAEDVEQLQKFAEQLRTNSSLAEEFTNKMKMASGRENIIQGLWNAFEGLASVLGTVKEAFTDIFPPMTGDQLYDLTVKFEQFTEKLKPSTETLETIKRIATGVFSGLQLIGKGISALLSPIGQLLSSDGMGSFVDMLVDGAVAIADFLTALNKSADTDNFFSTITDALGDGVGALSDLISSATAGVRNFGDIFTFVGETISNAASTIWDALTGVFSWIKENISLGDIFNGITAGTGILGAFQLKDIAKSVKEFFGSGILGMIFGTGDDEGPKESPLAKIGEQFTDILDGLHDSLQAFTTGIKATTLLEIAAAMWMLGDALEKIAAIDTGGMVQGLVGMGAMFTMLNFAFRGITKSLTKFDSGGVVKAGVTLIAMAYAMDKFADALVKVSDLNMEEIAKGLVALGGGLAELIVGLKFLDGVKINLRTIGAIVALSSSLDDIATALKSFATMNWDEIGRGLAAMGGALGELVAALTILSKAGGGGALLGSVGILIAVQSLGTMAEGLKSFATMNWDEIGRGLSAMGGALGELAAALAILSKVGGGGALLGSVGILIAVQSLGTMAEGLKSFATMNWDEIGRGLAAMGGALGELTIALGVLSKLGGFGSILGGTGILIAVQSLDEISENLKRMGSMSWEEIGKGLTAMGGALLAVAGFSGALGKIAGFSGLLGAGAILATIQGLDQLANGLIKFGGMDWETIGRGLVAMGGALALVAGGSILAGITGIAGLVGAGTITLAVQGLDQLATSLKKFGEMSWDEIGRGLTAMGAALGETALGGLLNTFSGFGAGAIAQVAEPLGVLADSVKKWVDVQVPEGLGAQLGDLAGGISAFWNSGWGADAIATVAGPLGTMADSVTKWSSVTVPEGLGEQIGSLAGGISAFWNSGWGADAIAIVAGPLGAMADSVSKWSSVSVPENMQSNLEGLAKGVSAFNFSALGGFSIGAIVEPLGNLAGSINQWNGVTVPENIQSMLEGIAKGVQAFTFAFAGGWSIGGLIDPLKNLAEAIKSYSGLSIATNIGDSIKSLGEGVTSLAGKNPGDISGIADAITQVISSAQAIANANLSAAAAQLTSFASAINGINVSGDKFANLGANMVTGFVNALNAGQGQIQAAAMNLANTAVNAFTVAVSLGGIRSSSAGLALIQGLSNGMQSGVGTLISTVNGIITNLIGAIMSNAPLFSTSGTSLITQLGMGMQGAKGYVDSALSFVLSNAASIIQSYYSSFYSAGAYISQGLASGMSSKLGQIRSAAAQMAQAAATATRAAAQVMSPSRVFMEIGDYMGQGLVLGMEDEQRAVYKAGYTLGDSAVGGLRKTVSMLGEVLNSDFDLNPTIRPVLDLSDVKNGADSISGMLNSTVPLNVLGRVNSIDRSMNDRIQNGTFDDVVKAVDRLRTGLSEIGGPSYTINGITYDDGSNIANTIGDLTRQIRLERRV